MQLQFDICVIFVVTQHLLSGKSNVLHGLLLVLTLNALSSRIFIINQDINVPNLLDPSLISFDIISF